MANGRTIWKGQSRALMLGRYLLSVNECVFLLVTWLTFYTTEASLCVIRLKPAYV